MGVRKNSNETVQLSPRSPRPIVMKQKTNMNMFEITHWDLFDCGTNQLSVQLVMKRKILSEIMTTYFPSFLLLAITFATTFFKPFFFEAALSVNLTTMLVMTTIFISKMESLPPTSDIKMIDIWLILCQLVPFAQVVLLTAMEYIREEEKEEEMAKQGADPQVARGKAVEKGSVLKTECETWPREAWVPMNTEPVQADMMQKLLSIGRLFL